MNVKDITVKLDDIITMAWKDIKKELPDKPGQYLVRVIYDADNDYAPAVWYDVDEWMGTKWLEYRAGTSMVTHFCEIAGPQTE